MSCTVSLHVHHTLLSRSDIFTALLIFTLTPIIKESLNHESQKADKPKIGIYVRVVNCLHCLQLALHIQGFCIHGFK